MHDMKNSGKMRGISKLLREETLPSLCSGSALLLVCHFMQGLGNTSSKQNFGGRGKGWQAFSKKCSQKEGNTRLAASSSLQNVQLRQSAFSVVNKGAN